MKIYTAPPRGVKEKASYLAWLTHLGHEPIWLDLRRKVKGPLLLCGGADLGKDPDRDSKEYVWIKQALEGGHTIIGICRGMQVLNQYFGGTVEDLNESMVHDHKAGNFAEDVDHSGKPSMYHIVQDLEGNLINVNSRHHQHCSKLADNFVTTHVSFPVHFIAEGFKDEEKKIWAVQWHPERMESEDNEYPLNKVFAK
jgi:putative glutamine amidotransferase|tara:strand:+ start:730 stop:1320 length:591 start_codon:yes stop_codon:yes gene_type:complete